MTKSFITIPGVTDSEPSNTALTAAAARAAHLIVDDPPFIFADQLAGPLLGGRASELVGYHRQHPAHPILSAARGQVIRRSRLAEHRLAAAGARGVSQYVLVGAGLDTFGYRSPFGRQVQVFEVDHRYTQEWKRTALTAAAIDVPDSVRFVTADLSGDSLADRLRASGFDDSQPALISWLGVIMYLDQRTISATLAALAGFAPGTELLADYMLPAPLRDEAGDFYVSQVGPAAAQHGEPWLTFLAPGEMASLLASHGFRVTAHVRQRDAVPDALWQRGDSLRPADLSMITVATLPAAGLA